MAHGRDKKNDGLPLLIITICAIGLMIALAICLDPYARKDDGWYEWQEFEAAKKIEQQGKP